MPSIQLFVLNSFHKEYSMSFIQCPYCQSTHVRQTDSGNANANYFEQLQRCISPTQMAMFGMQVAKVRLFAFSAQRSGCGGWRIGRRQSVLL
jgi:hypothetical protein